MCCYWGVWKYQTRWSLFIYFPEIFSNVLIRPVVCPRVIVRYFNECNTIFNQNRIRQYDLALEKYWLIQSEYFRIATTVTLGMRITDANLLFYNGISEQNRDKKFLTRGSNDSTVYDCLKKPSPVDCDNPASNLPPMPINDSSIKN